MPVLRNIATLALCKADGAQSDIHAIQNAALVWEGERIKWVGPEEQCPKEFSELESIDAGRRLVIPGLIDCHTHLAFGGWRADEFEMRLQGKSYLEIAQAGGGILSTVKFTRAATEAELTERCLGFLKEMAALGVTTVECKSGYGLDLENELKLLRVYRKLRDTQPLSIVSTFLGAHTVPTEYKEKRSEYVRLVIEEMLPRIGSEKLADFCDVFVEKSAFSKEEATQILAAARKHGLPAKLHVDQLSAGGGAELAAQLGAVSAEHLEMTSDAGMSALAKSGTVAVILPLASLCTFQAPLDARRLVKAGVPVAVATDFNPGSAPSFHLPLAMFLSCTLNHLTPAEALKAATIQAARALKLNAQLGSLEAGKKADFAVIDAQDVNHWMYHFKANACLLSVKSGKLIYRKP